VRASRAAFPLPVLVERRTNGGIRQATLFNWQILLSSTSSMYFTRPILEQQHVLLIEKHILTYLRLKKIRFNSMSDQN
jgi:hypothetical protein